MTVTFGLIFGIPHVGYVFLVSSSFFNFIVGFLAGYAVAGVFVIFKLVDHFSENSHIKSINLNCFYPDRSAETLIIGNNIFKFTLLSLSISVALFVYLNDFQWTNTEIDAIKWLLKFWELFPILLSTSLYFLPLIKLNTVLRNYKLAQQFRIKRREQYLADLIMNLKEEVDYVKIKDVSEMQKSLDSVKEYVEQMNTWPYNIKLRTAFITIIIPILTSTFSIAFKEEINRLFKKSSTQSRPINELYHSIKI